MTTLALAQEINNNKNKFPFKVQCQDLINTFFEEELKDEITKKNIKKPKKSTKRSTR